MGVLQGLALWVLYEAVQFEVWPATSPRVFGAAAYAAVVAPLAWYLAHDAFPSQRARVLFAIAMGAAFAGLGAHAGATVRSGALVSWPPSYVLAAVVLGFVAVSLCGAWDFRWRRFDYPRLFELTSRNAVLAVVAAGLTGALWIVLLAGAWLMSSIGIKGLLELYRNPDFWIPVTAAVLGLSFALALARAQMLGVTRQLGLSLAGWFLPLALLFALAWIAALPFTGVQPLFDTRNAAFYLLWFATLAIVFLNAAFQGGQRTAAYPGWLAMSIQWAWLTMPVLAVLAGWALWQRIVQHGWSEDRIWAALVWLLVAVVVTGYAASAFRRRRWMSALPRTNIAAALVLVVAVVALISPVADVQRLTVSSQLARLRGGAVEPGAFDWNLLARGTGSYGLKALAKIAASAAEDERSKVLAKHASDALRLATVPGARPLQDPGRALKTLRENIAVRPAGISVDDRLFQWLARADADSEERNCIATPESCALWLVDMNDDGQPEALLLWERRGSVQAMLYAQGPQGWRREASLHGPSLPLAVWLGRIDSGQTSPVPRKWPDLTVGSERFTVAR